MTVITTSHIEVDDRGVAYIKGKRFKVVVIVMDMMNGMSPAEIQQNHPHLSLAEVHAALTYYYDHQAELDAWIDQSWREAQRLREEAISKGTQPSRAKLLVD